MMQLENNDKDFGMSSQRGSSGEHTGIEMADTIKEYIRKEYPEMGEAHAMRLAVLLTKEQFKGHI